MLTEGELKAIDEVRQVYCSSDTDAVFLDYVLARLRQPRDAEGPDAGGSFDDPAIKPDSEGPTADEMFSWLRNTKTCLENIEGSGWQCWNGDRDGDPVITNRHDDPRDAVRAAMEIGVLG